MMRNKLNRKIYLFSDASLKGPSRKDYQSAMLSEQQLYNEEGIACCGFDAETGERVFQNSDFNYYVEKGLLWIQN